MAAQHATGPYSSKWPMTCPSTVSALKRCHGAELTYVPFFVDGNVQIHIWLTQLVSYNKMPHF